ncbi:MAG: aminotransferase class V-fold PLP-dependent enzyme, partial [Clostridia bacterium]|nr:aminotransferase class V-fold PLP-dependent enzyme [Clostridia bacterium]
LVALMLANNEIGTIQPVRETAEAAHSFGIPVLCDAVAACGQLPLDVSKIGTDYLVVSGHKIHGPKGIGFLYAKSGTPLSPLLDGGGQESGMRAGTENVAFAVGLAKALEGAALPQETDRLRALQTRLFDGLLSIEGTSVNGSMNPAFRLPGNVNISIPDLSAESILLLLDAAGISASAGSACNSESTEPSHVLLAIGRERVAASSSLRFTLSPDQTEEEIDTIIRETARIVRLLRTAQ